MGKERGRNPLSSVEYLARKLGKLVGSERVLTSPEDLYVYSFEKVFTKPRRQRFDIVVKVVSEEDIAKIISFAEKEKVPLVRRGTTGIGSQIQGKPIILLDTSSPPDVKAYRNYRLKRMETINALHHELLKEWHSVLRSSIDYIKLRSMQSLVTMCGDCTTCSGFCTVAPYFDFAETWSAKGRMLLAKGFMKGELKPSKKLVDIMYACSLCGACYTQCAPNLEINKALMEARSDIANIGLAPQGFVDILENIEKYGNPLRPLTGSRGKWIKELPEELKAVLSEESEALLWVGCNTSLRPEIAQALTRIAHGVGLNFSTLGAKEGCCGGLMVFSGFIKEAKRNAEAIAELLKEMEVKTLVTPCAGCYRTFADLYPNQLNVRLPCDVIHTVQLFEELINDGKLKFRKLGIKVAYHDPCELGRHCGIYEEPRVVLKTIPGLRLLEPSLSREYSRCCGGGGGLWAVNPHVSMECAHARLTQDIIPLKVDALLTACPQCHRVFRYTTSIHKMNVKIWDISEVLARAMKH